MNADIAAPVLQIDLDCPESTAATIVDQSSRELIPGSLEQERLFNAYRLIAAAVQKRKSKVSTLQD